MKLLRHPKGSIQPLWFDAELKRLIKSRGPLQVVSTLKRYDLREHKQGYPCNPGSIAYDTPVIHMSIRLRGYQKWLVVSL